MWCQPYTRSVKKWRRMKWKYVRAVINGEYSIHGHEISLHEDPRLDLLFRCLFFLFRCCFRFSCEMRSIWNGEMWGYQPRETPDIIYCIYFIFFRAFHRDSRLFLYLSLFNIRPLACIECIHRFLLHKYDESESSTSPINCRFYYVCNVTIVDRIIHLRIAMRCTHFKPYMNGKHKIWLFSRWSKYRVEWNSTFSIFYTFAML